MAPGATGSVVFALRQPLHEYVPIARGDNRDAAAVPDSRCRSCHEDVFTKVVVSNGIRVNHASCASEASCTDCHSTVAHGKATGWARSYDMDGCLECHMKSDNVACDLCHEGRRDADRVKSAFAVTHGAKWKSTHAMGNVATCTVCHSTDDCEGCHGAGVPHGANFVDVHSAYAVEADAQCATCHQEAFCTGCHGMQMPHPADFTPAHSSLVKKQGTAKCMRCHVEEDCDECHEMHVHPGGAVGTSSSGGGGSS